MSNGTDGTSATGQRRPNAEIVDDAILLNLNAENYFALDEVGTRLIATLQKGNSLNQAVRKLMGSTRWPK